MPRSPRASFAVLPVCVAIGACSAPPTHAANPRANVSAVASPSASAFVDAPLVPVDPSAPPPSWVPLASTYLGGFRFAFPGRDAVDGWLVESLGVLDQPAGVKGVVLSESPGAIEREVLALAFESATVANARGVRPTTSDVPADVLLAFLKGVRGNAQVKAAIADDGAQMYGLAQGTFLLRDQRVTKATATEAELGAIDRIVRMTEITLRCLGNVCAAIDIDGVDRGAIVVDGPISALRIAGVFDLDARPKLAATGEPALVASNKDTSATARAVEAAGFKKVTVLGEAALDARGGTHGIARVDQENGTTETFEVVIDGPLTSLLPLVFFDISDDESSKPPVLDLRFLDVDGDGRSEVILRKTSNPYPQQGKATMLALLRAPTSLRGTEPLEATFDPTYDPWIVRSATADAAASAVLAAQPITVSASDACAVLQQIGTPTGVGRYASPDAIYLSFQEPSIPSFAVAERIQPLSKVPSAERIAYFTPCDSLRCVGNFCTLRLEPPGSGHAWFDRDASGRPRVTAIAAYGGS